MFNKHIEEISAKHGKGAVTKQDCINCSSGCCSLLDSYAILENVVEIYDVYLKKGFKRKNFEFEKELSFRNFVAKHFNVVTDNKRINEERVPFLHFHMKSLDDQGRLVSLPFFRRQSYLRARGLLYQKNPWLNCGCVFLSESLPKPWPYDDKKSDRHCILHAKGRKNSAGAKPLICQTFICSTPYQKKTMNKENLMTLDIILKALRSNSQERFLELCELKLMKEFYALSLQN